MVRTIPTHAHAHTHIVLNEPMHLDGQENLRPRNFTEISQNTNRRTSKFTTLIPQPLRITPYLLRPHEPTTRSDHTGTTAKCPPNVRTRSDYNNITVTETVTADSDVTKATVRSDDTNITVALV